MQINEIIKTLAVTSPFSLLCALAAVNNLKKEQRGYQFASMIFGVLYSVVAIIFSDDLADRVLSLIAKLVTWLTAYAENNPDRADFCQKIIDFINDVDWEYYMIFIINFLMLAIFLVVKKILLPVFKSIWKNDALFSATSAICYEWNDERGAYVLKSKLCALRTIMNVYYWCTLVIVSVLLAACRLYRDWPGFQAVFYPFAVIIIIGEVVFFLGGKTRLEFADDLGGDGGESYKVVNYYRLRKYLKLAFGDRLIADSTSLPKGMHIHNNSEIVKKYENIDLQEARIANMYFRKKHESGMQLDEGYVDATYRLMNGESVLFANPFYRDYSEYIFLPLNRAATKGNNILFIIGRNGIEEDVKSWINDSFADVVNVPDMWEIDTLSCDKEFSGQVGIVTPADIFNEKIVEKNIEFLKNVSEVVMIEPSRFVSTSQLSVSVYITKVRENATYYVIDKNMDGLVDSISHIIRTSITEVSATNKERNISSYMLWKADGAHLSHRLFPNVARYLGVGTELMIAAIRNQVNFTEWYSYEKFPITDMKWISEQYYSALCDYASLTPKQEELERRMKFDHNMWGAGKSNYKFLVVEDEFCNLFEISRQFASRGNSESFVNVISQNYLLRDYMEYNPKLFETDLKAIPSFCPDYARTERNIVIELLLRLTTAPMEEDELVKSLRYLGISKLNDGYTKYDLKSVVFELVHRYYENECAMFVITEATLVNESNDRYSINNKKFIEAVTASLRCAYYVLEDEESEKYYLDAKLFGHVYQSHLPSQHVVLGGKYYEIVSIEGKKGVIVKRAADHIHDREYYRQLRTYNITSFDVDDKIGSRKTIGKLIVESGNMSFNVETQGYMLMSDYGNLKNALKKEVSNIPVRNYSGKAALKITFPGIDEKTKLTITLLLNEIFKTLYPDNSDFICAVTHISEENDLPCGLLYGASLLENDENCVYIIEDSVLDMGLLTSVERNLQRFFEIITDFLKWHSYALLPVKVKDDYINVDKARAAADGSRSQDEKDKPGQSGQKEKGKDGLLGFLKRRKKQKPQEQEPAEDADSDESETDGTDGQPEPISEESEPEENAQGDETADEDFDGVISTDPPGESASENDEPGITDKGDDSDEQ